MNKIGLIFSQEIGSYYYGENHPMQPKRISMTYELLKKYDLLSQFSIYQATHCSKEDLLIYHDQDYIDFMDDYFLLPESQKSHHHYGVGLSKDVPAFPKFFNYNKLVGGSSLMTANLIANSQHQVVLNWIGGLHHAMKNYASGFCYINDCVLAIERLLYDFRKVMYVDIDVHHGDGVEHAFLYNNRVLTFSIHQHGNDFFPRSGNLFELFPLSSKYDPYSINVPLKEGCSD